MSLPSRSIVRSIADEITAGRLAITEVVEGALRDGDGDRALAHVLASAVAGRPPSTDHVGEALALIDDLTVFPWLVGCCAGDRMSMLLDAVERGHLSHEREGLAL